MGISVPLESLTDFLDGHFVGGWSTFLGVERAELAAFVANVGVVDVLVCYEVGLGTVSSFANDICQVANGVEVSGLEELHSVFEAQTGSLVYLSVDFH